MSRVAETLYRWLPLPLQHVAVSGYGWRLRQLRYGGDHRAALLALRASQWWSADQHEARQAEAVRRVLRLAAEIPVYRALGLRADAAGLGDAPLLSKDHLQRPRDEVVHPAVARRGLLAIHTGGTTGKTLTVHCDRAALRRNYAFYARLLEWAGVGHRPRTATFAGRIVVPPGQDRPPYWRRNWAAHQTLFSSYHLAPDTLAAYVRELERWQPELVDSYPSSLEPIARFLLESGRRTVRPRAVVTSSETLTPRVRALLAEAFGAPVFDHYGAAEMAAFVSQCAEGTYHVNPEFGTLELLAGDRPAGPGEAGEIVATGFVNEVMPVVRYRTGDLAVAGDGPCGCGRAFPVLRRIVGRLDDVIITPEGRRVGRLDPVFKAVSALHEARIVQHALDHVVVEVVVRGTLPDAQRDELRRQLGLRLGSRMRIDVEQVAAIPRAGSGKLRTVVSAIAREALGAASVEEGFFPDEGGA